MNKRIATLFFISLIISNSKADDSFPKVPDDFNVALFAQEPLVRNPCAITFDKQGRLCVGMGPQYRKPKPETNGDSVWIIIDKNGDGSADSRIEFASGFNSIQGLAWNGNDLWVANAPDLTLVRDTNNDDLADEYVLYVFADEGYQLIYFDELPLPSMREFDGCSRVISFGSFSKILAPGLRTGWIHAAEEIVDKFTSSALAFSGGGFNQFGSVLIKHAIDLGLLEKNTDLLRKVYSNRSRVMGESLLKELGSSVEYTSPNGGFYYWIQFPEGFNTEEFLSECEDQGVSYRPGNAFSESGKFERYLRLTFTLYEEPEIAEGVARLASSYKRFS